MKRYTLLLFLLVSTHLLNAQSLINSATCGSIPKFVSSLGINSNEVAYSSSEKMVKGICLVYAAKDGAKKVYQDSNWSKYGNMGPLAIDEMGNAYVAPVPMVNVIDNKIEDQNKVYQINTITGKMSELINLKNKVSQSANPYGVIGLSYYCGKQLLYASSIAGSTADSIKGNIYCIQLKTKKVIGQLKKIDAMGVCVANFNNKPCLFFGNARNQNVYYVWLNSDGSMQQKINYAFSLTSLGPRGDDKAKKIRVNNKGELVVTGKPFYYNLTAPTDVQETVYKFNFNTAANQWQLVDMEHKGISVGYDNE
jgi:hypothetical protein